MSDNSRVMNSPAQIQNFMREIDSGGVLDYFDGSTPTKANSELIEWHGMTCLNPDGTVVVQITGYYRGTDALTLTSFAGTPTGTIIWALLVATPTIYVHKAQSASPVVGDWYKNDFTQCT